MKRLLSYLLQRSSLRRAVCCTFFVCVLQLPAQVVPGVCLSLPPVAKQPSTPALNLSVLLQDCVRAKKLDASHVDWHIPPTPRSYREIVTHLQSAELLRNMPEAYQNAILRPFLTFLTKTGESQVNAILRANPPHYLMQLIDDVYQALTQGFDPAIRVATDAFQEVSSDIYNGFLYKESRINVKSPELEILPPLVKWGSDGGPYTYGVEDLTQVFGTQFKTSVVVLPTSHLISALAGWSSLGHEVGGHDLLMADIGLLDELRSAVYTKVAAAKEISAGWREYLARYWSYVDQNRQMRINETASDVLGALHFGPAAAVGMLAYFPGYFSPNQSIEPIGSTDDPHPISIIRPFLIAQVIRKLPLKNGPDWAQSVENEARKQLNGKRIVLYHGYSGYVIPTEDFIQSARVVADAIADTQLKTLEGHSLRQIQAWSDADEEAMNVIANALEKGLPLPQAYDNSGFFAAHVVSAATLSALKNSVDLRTLFPRMQAFLAAMHTKNPDWTAFQGQLRSLEQTASR